MGRGKGTEKGKGKGGRREMGKRERRGGNGQGGEGRKCAPPIFTGAPHFLIPGVAPRYTTWEVCPKGFELLAAKARCPAVADRRRK